MADDKWFNFGGPLGRQRPCNQALVLELSSTDRMKAHTFHCVRPDGISP